MNTPEKITEQAQYKAKIIALMKKYHFGFLHNPGGGEFTHHIPGLRQPCQISNYGDFKEDYVQLMGHLIDAGLEEKPTQITP